MRQSKALILDRYTCLASGYWRPSEKALRSPNGIRCFPDAVSRQNCCAESMRPRCARLQYRKRGFVELPMSVPSPTIGPVSARHHTGLRSPSSRRTFDTCKWLRPASNHTHTLTSYRKPLDIGRIHKLAWSQAPSGSDMGFSSIKPTLKIVGALRRNLIRR